MGTFERVLWRVLRGNLYMNVRRALPRPLHLPCALPLPDPLPAHPQSAEIDDSVLPVPSAQRGDSSGGGDGDDDKRLRKNAFIIFAHGQDLLDKIRKIAECASSLVPPGPCRALGPLPVARADSTWLDARSDGCDPVLDRLVVRQALGQAARGDDAHRGPRVGPVQHEPDAARRARQDCRLDLGVVGPRAQGEGRVCDAQPVAVGPGQEDARRRGVGPDEGHPRRAGCAAPRLGASLLSLSLCTCPPRSRPH